MVDLLLFPLRDRDGVVQGLLCVTDESTDHVLAARSQREREAELRLVADALPLSIAFVDRNLVYRCANRAADGNAGDGPAEGHGTRVLVAEDNAEVGGFAVVTLREFGYRPTLACDAAAGLAALERDADGFDAVFTDVVVPGMDGVSFARRVAARHPGLPVLLTSGYSHVLAQEGTAGFELLRKPYSVEALSRALWTAVRRR